MEACKNPDILKIMLFANQLLKIAFIVIPIGLILMIGLDFFKNVTAGKEDDMKKNLTIVIKRIIYCVIIFFVPTIVKFVNIILNEVLEDTEINYTECFSNANSEYIEERIIEIAKEALETAKEKFTLSAAIEAEEAISKISDDSLREALEEEIEELKIDIRIETEANNSEDNREPITTGTDNSSTTENNTSNVSVNNATGYLKSPLNKNATQEQFIDSIGSNSREIYYLNGEYHGGTDLPVSIGTSVYAMDSGTVHRVQDGCGSYGRHIVLEHIVQDKKYYTIYAHLSSIEEKFKTIGTKVNQGELIAKSGNSYHCTGTTTVGAHLHIGIAYNSNGSFPQTENDKSFLVGNFIGTNEKYSIVDDSNLSYYKERHY